MLRADIAVGWLLENLGKLKDLPDPVTAYRHQGSVIWVKPAEHAAWVVCLDTKYRRWQIRGISQGNGGSVPLEVKGFIKILCRRQDRIAEQIQLRAGQKGRLVWQERAEDGQIVKKCGSTTFEVVATVDSNPDHPYQILFPDGIKAWVNQAQVVPA
ncbi:MAG: hypothetical protein ABIH87_02125 [bacterium]